MPPQVLPSETDFTKFELELKMRGFCPIPEEEIQNRLGNLSPKSPRSKHERERGFSFSANGLTVIVWTTWLGKESRARKEDASWVIIANNDRALYFSHPIHRTKNFLKNLLRQAWLAWWRVRHRPRCPECGKFMEIAFGSGIKSRYWKCRQTEKHRKGKSINLSWDKNLPPQAKRYVVALRRARTAYFKKLRRVGKPVYQAMHKRQKWERN